jgi:hypothetical protein
MTRTADFQSPVWLEASIRHARDGYRSSHQLAEELHAAGPEVVQQALVIAFSALSNRGVRQVADAASNWVRDLILCEEECERTGEELLDTLKQTKAAAQILCDYANLTRSARSRWDVASGAMTHRRQ